MSARPPSIMRKEDGAKFPHCKHSMQLSSSFLVDKDEFLAVNAQYKMYLLLWLAAISHDCSFECTFCYCNQNLVQLFVQWYVGEREIQDFAFNEKVGISIAVKAVLLAPHFFCNSTSGWSIHACSMGRTIS